MPRQHMRDLLPPQNVGSTERLLSMLAGGVLLASAFRRGHLLMGIAGGALAARGLSGYCPAYGFWGPERRKQSPELRSEGDDEVTLAAEQSFPASDPPSFNPGQA